MKAISFGRYIKSLVSNSLLLFNPGDLGNPGNFGNRFVFLRVLCGYFLFFFLDGVSGCAPVTLARTLSKASLAVISLLRLLFWRYLCSLLQVRQRVLSTSAPIMDTTEWSVVRLQLEQWSSMSSPSRIRAPSWQLFCLFCRKAASLSLGL
jgi:hypothetical protein